ncbi:hypothetical protein WJX81_001923 [Elliptochloris bilobata]|uniref:BACK domain-containing protein n=1 Tax=Elliptochloris bilobata TaxID=381761 RepID=A0AAW1RE00_9CHLO
MLRVNSASVLFVPPFECAWLSELEIEEGGGCLSFEARGETDVTVLFKSAPGSRRWQHTVRGSSSGDCGYTVILGSHRNRCLKIERDGQTCVQVDGVPGARLSSLDFTKFWISFSQRGAFAIGYGTPGTGTYFRWVDPVPLAAIRHVGLSTWDQHSAYRDIKLHPPSALQPAPASVEAQQADPVPSLEVLCEGVALAAAGPGNVCAALSLVEALAPAAGRLRAAGLRLLAEQLPAVLVADAAGFAALPVAVLDSLLQGQSLGCSEFEAYQAVTQWAAGGAAQADVERLLPLVRFPLMCAQEIKAVKAGDLAARSAVLRGLICEAEAPRQPDVAPGHAAADSAARFRRRQPPAATELLYVSDGDGNGVCRQLGTGFGRHSWVNPMLSGHVQVSASSPCCRHTDAKALVSGGFLRHNAAGPPSGGGGGAWWQLDLGARHRLACNHYTLRHDASPAFPRSWGLQGCEENGAWVDLRRHEADAALALPGQFASWSVPARPGSAAAFSVFRILLTGPNAAGTRELAVSSWELYGYLYVQPERTK